MFDLAIIGGGPGGYVAAVRAAQKGMKVALIEKDRLGGTCLNRGCIPTKSLYYDAKLFHHARTSTILAGPPDLTVDIKRMAERKDKVVNTMVNGLEALMKNNRIEVLTGTGVLEKPGRIRVQDPEDQIRVVKAQHLILANGSRPAVPSFIDVDGIAVQTTDHALEMTDYPDRMMIIGGGVIGLEMAAVFINLGSRVTIVELLEDVLVTEDKDVRQAMKQELKKRGATLHLKARAQTVRTVNGKIDLTIEDNAGTTKEIRGDRLLIAVGRSPVLDGIEPEKLGLAMNGSFVRVNANLETNLKGVYAIGDLVGGMMLAHKASAEAETAVDHIDGETRIPQPGPVPRCIWSLLEVGVVGLSEEEARQSDVNLKIGRFPLAASGAAQAMGHSEGFVKIIGNADTGEILGVHIVGEHATDLIGEAVTVIKMEGVVEDLCEAIKPHPSITEAVKEAALDWNSLAVHLPRKR